MNIAASLVWEHKDSTEIENHPCMHQLPHAEVILNAYNSNDLWEE